MLISATPSLGDKVFLSLSLDTALPPREEVDCVLKPRYKKCTEKEKIKMIVLKRMYKKNLKKVKNRFVELEHLMVM